MEAELIEEIRQHLSWAPKGVQIDCLAYANALADAYGISVDEIQARVKAEAKAVGIGCIG